MKNNYLILFLSVFLLKATTGYCTRHTITADGSPGSYAFSPDSISANVGDTIVFTIAGIHSALEVSQATWNANSNVSNGGFAVPFGGGSTVVNTAKTYYYVCQNHYSMGMKGRIFVTSATSINSLTSAPANLEVFPNPATTSAIIRTNLPAGKENQLRIFDMTGKCLYEKDNGAAVQSLDLSKLPSGLYFITLKYDDIFLEKKLVVSK